MKDPKRSIFLPLVLGIWLTILFMLTPLVIWSSGRYIPRSEIDGKDSHLRVRYVIDALSISDNLFMDVNVRGWSFIENEYDNSEKQVAMIFASTKQSYQVNLDVSDRPDVPPAFPDLKVPKYHTGFSGSFSPLAFQNGVYRLYIFNRENQNLYGLADTGREFLKQNHVFREMLGGEEIQIKHKDGIPNSSIKSVIDSCVVSQGSINVHGWAFVEEDENSTAPLLEIIKPDGSSRFFSTLPIERPDVAKAFNNPILLSSGFKAALPMDAIAEGDNMVRVYFAGVGHSANGFVLSWAGDIDH